MRRTEIHLSEPFEEVLASVLRLPSTLAEIDEVRLAGAADSELRKSAKCDAEVKKPYVLCMKRYTAGSLKRKLAL